VKRLAKEIFRVCSEVISECDSTYHYCRGCAQISGRFRDACLKSLKDALDAPSTSQDKASSPTRTSKGVGSLYWDRTPEQLKKPTGDPSLETPEKRCNGISFRWQGSVEGITYHLEILYDVEFNTLTVCRMDLTGKGQLSTVLRLISTLHDQLGSLSPKELMLGVPSVDLNLSTTGEGTSSPQVCGCPQGSKHTVICRYWRHTT